MSPQTTILKYGLAFDWSATVPVSAAAILSRLGSFNEDKHIRLLLQVCFSDSD